MTDMQKMLAGMVRGLEWAELDGGTDYDIWEAFSVLGRYKVQQKIGSTYALMVLPNGGISQHPTLEAAQSASQVDHNARILAALNPDTVLALVAAAYADAAECCTNELRNTAMLMSNPPQSSAAWDARNAITTRTPTDATAALARMLEEARAEGLEMAAAYCNGDEPGDFWPNLRAGIRAKKGEGA